MKPADAALADVVTRALRRVRPSAYQVGRETGHPMITLTVDATAAARRNAATRIVTALTNGGVRVIADDPVRELSQGMTLVLWWP